MYFKDPLHKINTAELEKSTTRTTNDLETKDESKVFI